MDKNEPGKPRYVVSTKMRSRELMTGLCVLMEQKFLLDVAITCGNHVLHAHKGVLAACSPVLRDAFEEDETVDQIVIVDCDYFALKSLIEYIYCGTTTVKEDVLNYFVAAARLLQVKGIEAIAADWLPPQSRRIVLSGPIFLTKRPKFPGYDVNNILIKQRKSKRKYQSRARAERLVYMREAEASRLAVLNLKRELGATPRPSTFVIDGSCTETTVEHFVSTEGGGEAEAEARQGETRIGKTEWKFQVAEDGTLEEVGDVDRSKEVAVKPEEITTFSPDIFFAESGDVQGNF